MILASFVTTAITPFAKLFGWLLAAFYSISGNYGIAIVLLTLVTMVVVFPLTRKGTRSMMQMQLLQPELLKMRNKYKKKPGMTPEERREVTAKQQEEMMALYRENGVSPTGGCLPMFMQFPVFIVLYNTIRGMTRTTTTVVHKVTTVVSDPEFISKKTRLYRDLLNSHGKMNAFGLNLADSVRSHQSHWIDVIPYVVVILIAVALQYVSIWQITNRNPSAGANQQMQQIQKFMPLIFVFIYIEFPAGVGLYFIVSSAFRIGQQEWMYKRDPHILESMRKLKEMKAKNPTPVVAAPKGFKARLAALAPQVDPTLEPSEEATRTIRKPPQGGVRQRSGQRPPGTKAQGTGSQGTGSRPAGQGPRPGQARRPGQSPRPAQSGQKRPPQGDRPAQPGERRPRPPGDRPAQPGERRPRPPGDRPAQSGQAKAAQGQPRPGKPGQPRPVRPGQNGQSRPGGPGTPRSANGNSAKPDAPPASNGTPDPASTAQQPGSGLFRRRGRPR
jgi:YidC/Oxa1 family membrane protein insertase